jgi:hypothetical protein
MAQNEVEIERHVELTVTFKHLSMTEASRAARQLKNLDEMLPAGLRDTSELLHTLRFELEQFLDGD